MTVIFQNPGLIDLRAITVMGINAKVSKNPIGQFGTGLKYSIAVLLRSNCHISIWRGQEEFQFYTEKETFRGKSFDFVYMTSNAEEKPTALGFTLELGKHWEPWMAIRELESNCRDEGGRSFAHEDCQLSPDTTAIVLAGAVADQEYAKLGNIFIKTKPLWSNEHLEVHPIENPEQQDWIYYRGVRCAHTAKPTAFRYNILSAKQLSEDRTFRYSWSATEELPELRKCTNREVLRKVVSATKDTTEGEIHYSQSQLSDEFIDEVTSLGLRATSSAWRAVRLAKGYSEYEEHTPDDFQLQMIQKAQAFIKAMGEPRIANFPVRLSADLGPQVLGRAESNEIWLALRVFEMGMKQVVSTMYEEYIHLDRKYSDLDYEMQNFLFDTIITQAAKLQGEIL